MRTERLASLWPGLAAMAAFFCLPAANAEIAFEDATAQTGISHTGESWSSAWGDFDADGWPDLWVTNHRLKPSLYVNNGDGTFTDVIDDVWFANPSADQHGAAWADFDNDGDQDLVVLVGGDLPTFPNHFNHFFVNSLGMLHEQGTRWGLDYPELRGRSPQWLDWDGDGLLDLALGGAVQQADNGRSRLTRQVFEFFEDSNSFSGFDCPGNVHFFTLSDLNVDGSMDLACVQGIFPTRLYDLTAVPFLDISGHVPTETNVFDVAVADFTGDLRPDVFLTRTMFRESQVFQQATSRIMAVLRSREEEKGFDFRSAGTFEYVGSRFKVENIYIGAIGFQPSSASSFVLSPSDPAVHGLNPHVPGMSDGLYIGYDPGAQLWKVRLSSASSLFELYMGVESDSPIDNVGRVGFGPDDNSITPVLLVNDAGGFQDHSIAAGFGTAVNCGSVATADFDNDMDLDIYTVCDDTAVNAVNRLYENLGDGQFVEVPNAGGAAGADIGVGASVALADYDRDGFVDIHVTNGFGEAPVNQGPDQIFRNLGNSNHWVEIDLVGTTSNRDGIGAKLLVTAGGKTQLREQAGGMHRSSQNHQRIHVGLGPNSVIDNLTVEWPSGSVQVLENLPADSIYSIIESNGAIDLPCGKPAIDREVDRALFLWISCETNRLVGEASPGGSPTNVLFEGSVVGSHPVSMLVPVGIESSDVLENNVAERVDFLLAVRNVWKDGFEIEYPPGTTATVELTMPVDVPIIAGPHRQSVMGALSIALAEDDVETDRIPCGEPTIDRSVDKAFFLWRDCATGYLTVQVTAGGGPKVVYQGVVSALEPAVVVNPLSTETGDVVDNSSPNRVVFDLNVQNVWKDGFEFAYGPGVPAIVNLALPGDVPLLVGADREIRESPFLIAP